MTVRFSVACLVLFAVACRRDPTAEERRPARIEGSCEGHLPMGALSSYPHAIRPRLGSGGFIRVRHGPSWSSESYADVIGEIRAGDVVPAFGPLKGEPSNGIGFAVPLRDDAGRQCRGYVSASVVDVVECGDGGATAPLPDPLDTIPGPCRPTALGSVQRAQ